MPLRSLTRAMARTGLPALLWQCQKVRPRQGRAFVLMYHRVSAERDYLGLCTPPAVFDRQMTLLRRRMRVLPLRQLAERLRQPEPLAEDVAAITFDDGYRDNLDVALPILERHGLPATVFVATGFIDGTACPAGERLRAAVEAMWRRAAAPGEWGAAETDLDRGVRAALARPGSLPALRRLRQQLKEIADDESERALARLEELAAQPTRQRAPMLSWNEVRTLSRRGIEIGSHTVSHAILSRLPTERAERELRASKARIEAAIDAPVLGFAYPNGGTGDFSADHVDMLRRGGYQYACTTEWGANQGGGDAFGLRRIGIGDDARPLLDLKLALAGFSRSCAA